MKRFVMITGATGGFGKALAAEYAQRGESLLLTDMSRPKLEALASGLRRLYPVAIVTRACDLTRPRSIDRLWRWVERRNLTFHGLLNVAGTDFEGRVDGVSATQVREIVRVNAEALAHMTRRILDFRESGAILRIVNVASLGCFSPMPYKATYAATKRFVYGFSIALGEEMRGMGVQVMVVCPAGMPSTPKNVISVNQCQGIMGFLTEKNVGWVAKRVYEHSLRGTRIYIPGRLNFILGNVGSLVPEEWKARLIGQRWQRALEKV